MATQVRDLVDGDASSDTSHDTRAAWKRWHAEMAALAAVLFAAVGHLLIKSGLRGDAAVAVAHATPLERIVAYFLIPTVIVGLTVYAVGTLLWVFAVSKREISYIFPISSLNYVAIALCGKVLLGEAVPGRQWLGISIVVLGAVLMQWRGRGHS